MAISNVTVVDTTSKYIVKSTGIGSEAVSVRNDQTLVDAEELTGGTNKSTVSLIFDRGHRNIDNSCR